MQKLKQHCTKCGEEIKKPQLQCVKCQKEKADMFYAYNELRYDMWNYLRKHGVEKTKVIYNRMCDDEGVDWVRDAIGNKLLKEIGIIGA